MWGAFRRPTQRNLYQCPCVNISTLLGADFCPLGSDPRLQAQVEPCINISGCDFASTAWLVIINMYRYRVFSKKHLHHDSLYSSYLKIFMNIPSSQYVWENSEMEDSIVKVHLIMKLRVTYSQRGTLFVCWKKIWATYHYSSNNWNVRITGHDVVIEHIVHNASMRVRMMQLTNAFMYSDVIISLMYIMTLSIYYTCNVNIWYKKILLGLRNAAVFVVFLPLFYYVI